ncbi:hypothetical protein FOTG_17649 [Fusarium oxysporum f. sp. vasinfectum 25433]|uniref:Protein kinase domain-containing protein n=1 Tax=Fusarium oxysporum f. sp. vasinfectum 25433 TaxID=1089449 RepID=X0KK72_FUSOX|nr:hypothetical protein FOTG_17649 [Fusarium oxysporum f. sp. vasinfectum 25433]
MRDIAEGLKSLHDCGIVHGDVKLENVLVFPGLDRKHIAKLSDFGHSLVDLGRGGGPQRYNGTPIMNVGLKLAKEDAASDRTVDALNVLPENELLLQALVCSYEYESEDPILHQVVRDIFRLTLPEDPDERGFAGGVIAMFDGRGCKFRDTHWDAPKMFDRPEPLPDNNMNYQRLRTLPLVVRDGIIRVLEYKASSESSGPLQERCDAKFDLALCIISGVPTSRVPFESGMKHLEEAAELGSIKSLSCIFRLYEALSRTLPQSLQRSNHPIARLERELPSGLQGPAGLPGSYMTRRIIAYERLYQQEALSCEYDLFYQGRYLFSSSFTELLLKLDLGGQVFVPMDLQCSPSSIGAMIIPQHQVSVIHLAAKPNQCRLVDYLLRGLPRSLLPEQEATYHHMTDGLLGSWNCARDIMTRTTNPLQQVCQDTYTSKQTS